MKADAPFDESPWLDEGQTSADYNGTEYSSKAVYSRRGRFEDSSRFPSCEQAPDDERMMRLLTCPASIIVNKNEKSLLEVTHLKGTILTTSLCVGLQHYHSNEFLLQSHSKFSNTAEDQQVLNFEATNESIEVTQCNTLVLDNHTSESIEAQDDHVSTQNPVGSSLHMAPNVSESFNSRLGKLHDDESTLTSYGIPYDSQLSFSEVGKTSRALLTGEEQQPFSALEIANQNKSFTSILMDAAYYSTAAASNLAAAGLASVEAAGEVVEHMVLGPPKKSEDERNEESKQFRRVEANTSQIEPLHVSPSHEKGKGDIQVDDEKTEIECNLDASSRFESVRDRHHLTFSNRRSDKSSPYNIEGQWLEKEITRRDREEKLKALFRQKLSSQSAHADRRVNYCVNRVVPVPLKDCANFAEPRECKNFKYNGSKTPFKTECDAPEDEKKGRREIDELEPGKLDSKNKDVFEIPNTSIPVETFAFQSVDSDHSNEKDGERTATENSERLEAIMEEDSESLVHNDQGDFPSLNSSKAPSTNDTLPNEVIMNNPLRYTSRKVQACSPNAQISRHAYESKSCDDSNLIGFRQCLSDTHFDEGLKEDTDDSFKVLSDVHEIHVNHPTDICCPLPSSKKVIIPLNVEESASNQLCVSDSPTYELKMDILTGMYTCA
jgi:hypothetical protein